MRPTQEIETAMRVLADFEAANPGLKAQLTLYTDGEGAIVIENRDFETVDAIDFTENASLTDVAQRIVKRAVQTT
jgi:hypothetical protein